MPAPLGNPFLSPFVFSSTLVVLLINSLLFYPCSSVDVQGQALLTWRNSLRSPADALRSWNPADRSPCNWFGVYCNSDGEVVKMILKSMDLQGPLPSNFQSLKSLNTLILSSANLTGTIPKEFRDYSELQLIDISDNSISGNIPVEICRLTKLQSLYINTNSLEGKIPSEIGNLSSLVNLTLFDNQFTGQIPKSIGKLSNLEIFRAGGNQNLKGELPWEIGNCTNLVVLGLAETGISGIIPPTIGRLKRIQTIAIYTTLLSGPIPDDIGNCSELQNLYLYENSLSGTLPKRLGDLRKLNNLLLWQNSFVGTIPYELGDCKQLKVVDLSENLLNGSVPTSFGGLTGLQELQLSVNRLSGTIPPEITNCTALVHLELDNNALSGEVPPQIGKLKSMTLFFAWRNNISGNIPDSISECESLQALDLSYNHLTGPIPTGIFALRNLTKLLLLSNNLSGFLPPHVGNCTNLYRFRVNGNRLAGTIPLEIGNLKNLNFLDMSSNFFVGGIPSSISGCENLEFLDLHSNLLAGSVPDELSEGLQLVDISDNKLTGWLSPGIGSLIELSKLNLGRNQLSGKIPAEILSCSKLQSLDLGDNGLSGTIPKELGQMPALDISLNLSYNQFTGNIPSEFSGLSKLTVLDMSHNKLSGNLDILKNLENLVSLNVSFNDFSGELPNTPFFRKLPLSDLAGNKGLYISGGVVTPVDSRAHGKATMRLAMPILVSASIVLVLLATYMLIKTHIARSEAIGFDTWELTLYQKMEFSIEDIIINLTSANVIGTGSSGVVYRVMVPNGETLAVKKMWSSEESGAFSSEIRTLGSIRHKNIVRLLGWASNQTLNLLFYDYLSNGSLSSLLHGVGKGKADWETRYDILLGVGHALAYLHHDCLPAIIHGDVKAMNILLGPRFEPYLADFGLARLLSCDDSPPRLNQRPHLAGSYGYMAPEHASMERINEKSDVYSFGVVLLEVLTGRHPLDPTLPGGSHLVQWVRDHLVRKCNPADVLDQKLRGLADPQMHEMLQTLAVSFLCVSKRLDDRPAMKDVVAMLREIRHVDPTRPEQDMVKASSLVSHTPSPPQRSFPTGNAASQGSSSCSFAFSDDLV